MSNEIRFQNHLANGANLTADVYYTPNGSLVAITTESIAKIKFRQAGTLKNIAANVIANTTTVMDVYFRVNGVSSTAKVSYASGDVGIKEDLTNTQAVAVGDDVNYFCDLTSGANITLTNITCTFKSSGNPYKIYSFGQEAGISVAEPVTTYLRLASSTANTTEARVTTEMRHSGTIRDLFVNVIFNDIAVANGVTISISKNGSTTGAPSVVYGSSETGIKEDTSTKLSFVKGDLISIKIVTLASAGTRSVKFTVSIGMETISGYQQNGLVASQSTTSSARYLGIKQPDGTGVATESQAQCTWRSGSAMITEIIAEVNVIGASGSYDLSLRVNGVTVGTINFLSSDSAGTKYLTLNQTIRDGDEVNWLSAVTGGQAWTMEQLQMITLIPFVGKTIGNNFVEENEIIAI